MHIPAGILLAPLLAFAAIDGNATVVHKWVDADGVTHYSDKPPPSPVSDFERIRLPTAPAVAALRHDDYYSIANQWQRMLRERIEIERARLERHRNASTETRADDPIVIQVIEPRPSVTILPRHRRGLVSPKSAAPLIKRHPLAIPGRDWPVGLHPGRMRLRGGFESR